MQFTADICQLDLVVAEVAESSARGAAMAAMLALGTIDSLADLTRLRGNVQTHRPTMDRAKADELYRGWQQAVQRVL
jgi:glycerol kinase